MCNKCRNETIWNAREGYNNNEGEDEALVIQEQLGETIIHNNNINKRNTELKNQGFINSKKHEDCIRILALNPRGFGPNNHEKINMLKQAMVEYKIDAVLFSGTDRRWNKSRTETIRKMMQSVNKSIEIIASDSGEDPKTNGRYLPGGTMSILIKRVVGMVNKEHVKKDRLGR